MFTMHSTVNFEIFTYTVQVKRTLLLPQNLKFLISFLYCLIYSVLPCPPLEQFFLFNVDLPPNERLFSLRHLTSDYPFVGIEDIP